MSLQYHPTNRRGFTLVEIMIVVAIIALLASIAVPNFLRARKRSQATRILEDLRQLDSATDMYAMENIKQQGRTPRSRICGFISRPQCALYHRLRLVWERLRAIHRGHDPESADRGVQ